MTERSPPVELEPRNISLVIGAAFQFTHSGGPADCSLQFSVGDLGLASTNQEGLVTALALGSTSLTVTAVDSEGKVYSRDTVKVMVRALTSLQIVSPTSTVLAGTKLPLYLFGQVNIYLCCEIIRSYSSFWSGPRHECLQLRLRSASAQH